MHTTSQLYDGIRKGQDRQGGPYSIGRQPTLGSVVFRRRSSAEVMME